MSPARAVLGTFLAKIGVMLHGVEAVELVGRGSGWGSALGPHPQLSGPAVDVPGSDSCGCRGWVLVLDDFVEVLSNGWAESPAIGATEKAPNFVPHCGVDKSGAAAPLLVWQQLVHRRRSALHWRNASRSCGSA